MRIKVCFPAKEEKPKIKQARATFFFSQQDMMSMIMINDGVKMLTQYG